MSSNAEKHIDELIRKAVREHMQDAGEPRPDVLWAGIRKEIAAQKKTGSCRSLLTCFALPRWHFAGAAAVVACLLLAAVFFPEQLTALGKRVFYTAQTVQETDDGMANIATGRYPQEDMKALSAPDAPPSALDDELRSAYPSLTKTPQSEPPEAFVSEDAGVSDPVTTRIAPEGELPQEDSQPRLFSVSLPETEKELTLQDVRRMAPFPVRYPSYIPSGFKEEDISYQPLSAENGEVVITFGGGQDDQAVIRFIQMNLVGGYSSGQGFDPEQTTVQDVQIKGNQGTLLLTETKDRVWSDLSWFEDDMVYKMHGDVEPGEIIKMAESLKP